MSSLQQATRAAVGCHSSISSAVTQANSAARRHSGNDPGKGEAGPAEGVQNDFRIEDTLLPTSQRKSLCYSLKFLIQRQKSYILSKKVKKSFKFSDE